jgi:hypothetical protein
VISHQARLCPRETGIQAAPNLSFAARHAPDAELVQIATEITSARAAKMQVVGDVVYIFQDWFDGARKTLFNEERDAALEYIRTQIDLDELDIYARED